MSVIDCVWLILTVSCGSFNLLNCTFSSLLFFRSEHYTFLPSHAFSTILFADRVRSSRKGGRKSESARCLISRIVHFILPSKLQRVVPRSCVFVCVSCVLFAVVMTEFDSAPPPVSAMWADSEKERLELIQGDCKLINTPLIVFHWCTHSLLCEAALVGVACIVLPTVHSELLFDCTQQQQWWLSKSTLVFAAGCDGGDCGGFIEHHHSHSDAISLSRRLSELSIGGRLTAVAVGDGISISWASTAHANPVLSALQSSSPLFANDNDGQRTVVRLLLSAAVWAVWMAVLPTVNVCECECLSIAANTSYPLHVRLFAHLSIQSALIVVH